MLNGYGDLLLGRTHEVEDNDAVTFLEVLPQYQVFWSLYMWCCFWLFLVLIWKTLFYIGLLCEMWPLCGNLENMVNCEQI